MLTAEQNEMLTRIENGALMGELLRRYWHPVAPVAELDDRPTKPVRLFGEDLVLYRDLTGSYGLLQRHCPHRGFDLSYGKVEQRGLRCRYHGWCYNAEGNCIEQPFDEIAHPGFKDKVHATAYPVRAKRGLLWAYMGPRPAPLIPNWEPFTWENAFVYTFFAEVPCNWLQCHENTIDPVHFEWLHFNWLHDRYGEPDYPVSPRHLKLQFHEFEYGFRYGRLVEGQDEDDEVWTVGRVSLWPNAFFTGNNFSWRVPVDDRTTLCVDWNIRPVPSDRVPYTQERIPYSWLPLYDKDGRLVVDDITHQDYSAFVLQGAVADRTREHLGSLDRGVTMLRKKLIEQAELVARGGEPMALIRDEAKNECVSLPIAKKEALLGRASEAKGFDAVQRARMQRHLISGLSEETIEMMEDVFGEKPAFA